MDGGRRSIGVLQSGRLTFGFEGMIPEAAGATPIGIFSLADAFLEAARDTAGNQRKLTEGPTRLLCFHACELFLKAFLRQCGEDIPTLRGYGHDLQKMLESAIANGLTVTPQIIAQIRKASKSNDYVRVRYMVVEDEFEMSVFKLLTLTKNLRDSVRGVMALDEWGMSKR